MRQRPDYALWCPMCAHNKWVYDAGWWICNICGELMPDQTEETDEEGNHEPNL